MCTVSEADGMKPAAPHEQRDEKDDADFLNRSEDNCGKNDTKPSS
jgi:hypothetical protein